MVKKILASMTPGKSNQRLFLYAFIASMTALITDVGSADEFTTKTIVLTSLNFFLSGAIAIRAYLDESPVVMSDVNSDNN